MLKFHFYNHAHPKITSNLPKYPCIHWTSFEEADYIYSASVYVDPSLHPAKKFIFGPQFSILPNEIRHLNLSHGNCIYVQPSQWVVDLWTQNFGGFTSCPIRAMPVGVDTAEITPIRPRGERRGPVLVYFKRRLESELKAVCELLEARGIEYTVVKYGSYQDEAYKRVLSEAPFGVLVNQHESQGFAILEALSKDVPLLVWDVKRMSQEAGCPQHYHNATVEATSVPYWSDACGERVYSEEELPGALDRIMVGTYAPREFVVQTVSIEACARALPALLTEAFEMPNKERP